MSQYALQAQEMKFYVFSYFSKLLKDCLQSTVSEMKSWHCLSTFNLQNLATIISSTNLFKGLSPMFYECGGMATAAPACIVPPLHASLPLASPDL